MAEPWISRGDLWKNKVRSLQFRLRDRFRIAVDKHYGRRRTQFSHGYLSSSIRRCLLRFRKFRADSLPSSSVFSRKLVPKDIDSDEESLLLRFLRTVALPVIGTACHVFMNGLNRVEVYGAEKLHQAMQLRPKNQPLVTVSNHVASMDDPLVLASLIPPGALLDAHNLRWTLCATDRCFKNSVTSAFFRCVKVLPVSRGDGIYQKGLDLAISKLNRGGWVHIFPEGTRSRDGGRTMGSAKRGVGRLILDANATPIVIPIVHTGMEEIMPIGSSLPRISKTVTVLVGDPIYLDDLVNFGENQDLSSGEQYDAITSRIGNCLKELKVQVDKLVLERELESQNHQLPVADRVAKMMHQVDWESFGMENCIFRHDDSSSFTRKSPTQPKSSESHLEDLSSTDQSFGINCRTLCRIRNYMHPTELMGFAARGLFSNNIERSNTTNLQVVGPLKAWKQFWEANVFQQWNPCL
ncbi:Phospholipid/glycerol acyltransferase [Dillenia turbinata]|uniref:Tafazzin family protein n=1 Tax=Dillenia turbinata TaxID=194707 RepID=A0AAN8U9Z9_9MAGN